jgi:hypothetical protein
MEVGHLSALHRYPVKSLMGESLETATLGPKGIPGDRAWAVRDEARGGIQGAKKIPSLMNCAARYLEEPSQDHVPPPQITLPDGSRFLASDEKAAARLSAATGRELTLWPLLPPDALDHYRRSPPDDPDFEKELRAIFAREPGEPLPDIGKFPPEILQYESPPGTYFDAFPLVLLSEASLAGMSKAAPESRFDVRRFRPNLLLQTSGDDAFPEAAWGGRKLRIGEAVLDVVMECPRCVMTTHGFADLPEDRRIMRALVRETGGNLGAYAVVARAGRVEVGDAIVLE